MMRCPYCLVDKAWVVSHETTVHRSDGEIVDVTCSIVPRGMIHAIYVEVKFDNPRKGIDEEA